MLIQVGQQGTLLGIIIGSLTTLALALIPIIWKWHSRRQLKQRSDLAVTSQVELKRIEDGADQRHEIRDDLKEARMEIRKLERENVQLMIEKAKAELRCSQLEDRNGVLEAHHKNCDARK